MSEYPKHGSSKKNEETLKVETLACSSCGGQIDGPGKCPNCGQFLIVVEGGNYLRITQGEIASIKITRPSSPDGDWKFEEVGGLREIKFSEEDVLVIGNGNIEFGSLIIALYFKNNLGKHGLAGQLRPKIENIRAFAVKAAFKQAAKRNS